MAPDSDIQSARSAAQDNLSDRLVDIAVDAAIKSFVVMILGNIALSLVGSIAGRMIPSPPPGLAAAVESSATWTAWWAALKAIKFYLIFFILFFFGFRARFARETSTDPAPTSTTRWQRFGRRFSENWFGSLVGNAFLAMAIAAALLTIPKFSFWHWFWNWLSGVVKPEQVLGEDWLGSLRPWLGWYDGNQLQFNFWVIYLGGVCDDLGIPNFKSLTRWLRRRKHKHPAPGKVATPNPPENP